MNGPIHEMVLVALSAQAGLQGDDSVMAQFWPSHPAVQWTQWVNFAEATGPESAAGDEGPGNPKGDEEILAEDPPDWVQLLRSEGVTSVRIAHGVQTDGHMDRMTSGFVGGGRRWAIHTSNGEHHDLWLPRLALDQEERDRMIRTRSREAKIWRSSYLRRDEARHGPFDADLEGAAEALAAALEDVIAFAGAQGAAHWIETAFEPALGILERRRGVDPDRSRLDFKPFVRLEPAGRLLNTVMAAWVFGGMGSWNDQVIAPKEEYDRVSEALFAALHRAIAAGVNAAA